ncbi:MAG: hypothetical protein H8E78_06530 [Proteobacteria bacterium]|nr:hypothetical protein [Pseudomonadota bacterium]
MQWISCRDGRANAGDLDARELEARIDLGIELTADVDDMDLVAVVDHVETHEGIVHVECPAHGRSELAASGPAWILIAANVLSRRSPGISGRKCSAMISGGEFAPEMKKPKITVSDDAVDRIPIAADEGFAAGAS